MSIAGERIEDAKGVSSVMVDSSPTHLHLCQTGKLKGKAGSSWLSQPMSPESRSVTGTGSKTNPSLFVFPVGLLEIRADWLPVWTPDISYGLPSINKFIESTRTTNSVVMLWSSVSVSRSEPIFSLFPWVEACDIWVLGVCACWRLPCCLLLTEPGEFS